MCGSTKHSSRNKPISALYQYYTPKVIEVIVKKMINYCVIPPIFYL